VVRGGRSARRADHGVPAYRAAAATPSPLRRRPAGAPLEHNTVSKRGRQHGARQHHRRPWGASRGSRGAASPAVHRRAVGGAWDGGRDGGGLLERTDQENYVTPYRT